MAWFCKGISMPKGKENELSHPDRLFHENPIYKKLILNFWDNTRHQKNSKSFYIIFNRFINLILREKSQAVMLLREFQVSSKSFDLKQRTA